MNTAILHDPGTVREFLFGDGPDIAADALTQALHEQEAVRELAGGVHGLTAPVARIVEREVASVVEGFLALDVVDLAAGGWRRHAALREAARRTREVPGSEEVVALATHRITSSHQPQVDVLVDGTRVGTVDLDLRLVFDLEGLVVVVRDARLTAVRSGRCLVTGRLAAHRILLAQRQGQVNLPGAVHLRHGLRLLPEPPPAQRPPPPPHSPPAAAGDVGHSRQADRGSRGDRARQPTVWTGGRPA
ncbi:hypothetical protein OG689_38880 [Kitasatospora sp. NBC_00240]|uniref:hypothetical protein n=1 Tax=Kitasatospora sp. NBC_00240 TaxID=2903567 RepID=UPI002253DFE3|nr:hypothetical protein [Kitasatospora sp. NBC_00240]MCX5215162.1 hypothetical protein [Kitasatospora sp. NBC_00240]